jgi:anti-sigma factor RsiW
MNCQDCIEQLIPLAEGLLDPATAQNVQNHVVTCSGCQAEHQATVQLRNRLLRFAEAPASGDLVQSVMDRISREQVVPT